MGKKSFIRTTTTILAALSLATFGMATANATTGVAPSSPMTNVQEADPILTPTVTSLDPVLGLTEGDDYVGIEGTNLGGVTEITFGGVAATSIIELDDTSLIAVTPPHAPGLVDVVVTTTGGTVTVPNAYTYYSEPGAPTNLVASTGDHQISATFTAAEPNGSAITNYQYTLNGGTSWTRFVPDTTTSPVVVNGLVNGTTYKFGLRAINAAGAGKASAIVNVIPAAKPTAPRNLTGVPGASGVVKVSWLPPASDGGIPVTKYTVTSSSGGKTCVVNALTCNIGGLTNGTPYTFTATATNKVGTGPVSVASGPVVPRTVPSAVRNLKVISFPRPGQAVIAWNAPVSNGGATILGYQVRTSLPNRPAQYGPWSPVNPALTKTLQLNRGATYNVQVVAVNAAGQSVVVTIALKQANVPTPVRNLKVDTFPAPGQVRIAWVPPVNTGGSPITGYKIRISAANNTKAWSAWVTIGSPARLFTGLTKGALYGVQVTATNAQGESPIAGVTFRMPTVPTAVSNVKVSNFPTANSATLVWSPPASNGGFVVTGYKARISGPNNSNFGAWSTVGSRTITYGSLVKGATYKVQVLAVNAAGEGPATIASFRQPTAPSAPTGLRLSGQPAPGKATVTWLPPASTGGSPVIKYLVKLAAVSSSSSSTQEVTSFTAANSAGVKAGPVSVTLSGLVKGKTYKVQVTAVNIAGEGVPASIQFMQLK